MGEKEFLLSFSGSSLSGPSGGGAGGQAAEELRTPRLERAIGVIYQPQTEREGHYFQARVADQFDAIIHHHGSFT